MTEKVNYRVASLVNREIRFKTFYINSNEKISGYLFLKIFAILQKQLKIRNILSLIYIHMGLCNVRRQFILFWGIPNT